MTEMEETDSITKKILAGSRHEIIDSGLTDHIMQKITRLEKQKMIRHAILCSFLGLCTLGVVLFLAVQNIDSPKYVLADILKSTASQFANNQVTMSVILLITPLLLVLIFQRATRKNQLDY